MAEVRLNVEDKKRHEQGLFVTLAIMYFACGFVAQFAAQGVGLFLRDAGAPSGLVGLLYVAAIPYTLRFVWAPMVDRVRPSAGPRFRPWIIGSQSMTCLVLAAMAFLDPATSGSLIVLGVAALMIALGTQTVALGGLMVEGLSARQYTTGATIKAAASAAAGLLLGAVVLYLLADFGWLVVISALFAVSITLLFIAVTALDFGDRIDPGPPPSALAQFSIFGRSGPRALFGASILLSMAALLPYAAKSILLIDAGFSVSEGGLIGIVFGSGFGVLGALAARAAIPRIGAVRVMGALGFGNFVVAMVMAVLLREGLSAPVVVAGVLWANFAVFATFTANRSLLMPLCRPGRQATEMATFASLEAIVFLAIAGGALSLIDQIGIAPLLIFMAAVTAVGLYFIWRVSSQITQSETTS
ncbi:MAG: hypothetical protein AAGK77_11370 [Pseudomonadota bacterium]